MDDQTRLIKETKELERQHDGIEKESKRLMEEVDETDGVLTDLGDQTELSKFFDEKQREKDEIREEYAEKRDKALVEDKDPHKENSLLIEEIGKLMVKEKERVNRFKEELDWTEFNGEIKQLKVALKEGTEKFNQIRGEWESVELPPISTIPGDTPSNSEQLPPIYTITDNLPTNSEQLPLSQNNEDAFHTERVSEAEPSSAKTGEKKSSLLDDFADPSTEPADYIGWDD